MVVKVFIVISLFLIGFIIQVLGFMKLIPLYLSSPILLMILFLLFYNVNSRNRFKW